MSGELLHDLALWIAQATLAGADEAELLEGFCRRLGAAGIHLYRAAIILDTLHPVLEGRFFVWRQETDRVVLEEYSRARPDTGAWQRSPFYRLDTSGESLLRRRLTVGHRQDEFPLLDELAAAGVTDYFALVHRLEGRAAIGGVERVYSSWTTSEPGGFSDCHIDFIERAAPSLTLALKSISMARIAQTLVETYLGPDAAGRVLKGNIERGTAEKINAVLWLSDLEGFTKIADSQPPEQLIPLLNDYADCFVSAIHGHGGHVLKFMGDGILAIFPIDDMATACSRAVGATDDAVKRLRVLKDDRARRGLAVTGFHLALHVGEVFYGNIGSAERLDFTVVGPAVNEVGRIEAMCRSLDQAVILSSTFAAVAGGCNQRLVSLGRYALRGVRAPQELFTLTFDDQG